MHHPEWEAILKKYRECSSYADVGRLTTNTAAELSFATHFVRSNCLRLEWRGIPLEERNNGGEVEHCVLLAMANRVTVVRPSSLTFAASKKISKPSLKHT